MKKLVTCIHVILISTFVSVRGAGDGTYSEYLDLEQWKAATLVEVDNPKKLKPRECCWLPKQGKACFRQGNVPRKQGDTVVKRDVIWEIRFCKGVAGSQDSPQHKIIHHSAHSNSHWNGKVHPKPLENGFLKEIHKIYEDKGIEVPVWPPDMLAEDSGTQIIIRKKGHLHVSGTNKESDQGKEDDFEEWELCPYDLEKSYLWPAIFIGSGTIIPFLALALTYVHAKKNCKNVTTKKSNQKKTIKGEFVKIIRKNYMGFLSATAMSASCIGWGIFLLTKES